MDAAKRRENASAMKVTMLRTAKKKRTTVTMKRASSTQPRSGS